MRAIFEIVMSPCDVMYPKFWINGNCKKFGNLKKRKQLVFLGKYITYFSKYCKDTRYIFQSRVQSMTIG